MKAPVHATPEILRNAQMIKARVIWSTTPMAVIPVLAVTRQGGQSFVFVAQPAERPLCGPPDAGHAGRYGGQQLLHHLGAECGRPGDRIEHAVPGERHAGDADGRLRYASVRRSLLRMTIVLIRKGKQPLFVDFFIHRPVFATVCALLIILAGAVCIPNLPVAMYPTLAPPVVAVDCNYVGANADTVEKAVTIPLEEAINGVEGMRYISSSSTNSGTSSIATTFKTGYDLDIAAVDVQNRVASVHRPAARGGQRHRHHHHQGQSHNFVFGAGFFTRDGRYSPEFISNYLDVYVKDALKRVPGVGDVMIFGERKYAMRVWLDPVRLAARSLTATDVVNALVEQNVEIPAGQLGQPPSDCRSRPSRSRCASWAGSPVPPNSTTSSSRTPPTAWCC